MTKTTSYLLYSTHSATLLNLPCSVPSTKPFASTKLPQSLASSTSSPYPSPNPPPHKLDPLHLSFPPYAPFSYHTSLPSYSRQLSPSLNSLVPGFFHCLQPFPHLSFHTPSIPMTASTNPAPAPPGGNPSVLMPPFCFRRSPGRLHLGHSVVPWGALSWKCTPLLTTPLFCIYSNMAFLKVYSFGREIMQNRQYYIVKNEVYSSRIECTPHNWGCLFFALLE